MINLKKTLKNDYIFPQGLSKAIKEELLMDK